MKRTVNVALTKIGSNFLDIAATDLKSLRDAVSDMEEAGVPDGATVRINAAVMGVQTPELVAEWDDRPS